MEPSRKKIRTFTLDPRTEEIIREVSERMHLNNEAAALRFIVSSWGDLHLDPDKILPHPQEIKSS